MRKVALAFAAVAALSFTAPAGAQVTDYSISGYGAQGSFTLDYDSGTSTYSLTSLYLLAGSPFTEANSGLGVHGSNSQLYLGGNEFGPGSIGAGHDDFITSFFDPTLASQSAGLSYNYPELMGVQGSNVTISQTGTNGSITDYSISGSDATGTFSLNYDSGTSTYSLVSLYLIAASPFTEANSGLGVHGSNSQLYLGGNEFGPGSIGAGHDDFITSFFDPTLASQSAGLSYNYPEHEGVQGTDVVIAQLVPGLPEPASWAMMLLGFGAIGLAMRRRKVAAFA